jgi:hypothetical protein
VSVTKYVLLVLVLVPQCPGEHGCYPMLEALLPNAMQSSCGEISTEMLLNEEFH